MRLLFFLASGWLLAGTGGAAEPAGSAGKAAMTRWLGGQAAVYCEAAMQIWKWAEPGYQETMSSALLLSFFEKAGFTVQKGVAGIPTAFVAAYGTGKPVIGLLGEFDALPGLAQEAVPEKTKRNSTNGYGHACGHHLFGVASMAAALAVAEQIKSGALKGTVRFYATPAEEGGAAKVYMARNGLFDDCDAVLHWHPADHNSAGDPSNLARIAAKFRFYGQSAHAAGAPDQGRSALDAVELMDYAAEMLREHTPDFTRIHHVITAGGKAPNVVPDFAEVYYYVRHPDATVVKAVYDRLVKCAEAGALATETRLEIEYLGGTHNILPNNVLSRVTLKNLREQNNLHYTAEETAFAQELQKTLQKPAPLSSIEVVEDRQGQVRMGSTDVGDVSWVVPTSGLRAATWVPGTPAHSWQAVAAGGTSIGCKGMMVAARALAATAWDLYTSPALLEAARAEHQQRLAGHKYAPMLEAGQQPPLHYRDAPSE